MLIKYLFCQFALGTDDIELKDPVGFVVFFFCFFFFWLEEGHLLIGYIDKKKIQVQLCWVSSVTRS